MTGLPGLVGFYMTVSEVQLPDVGNGYFIHRPSLVLAHREAYGHVLTPTADGPQGLIFASTGGGNLFVVDRDSAVFRS